LEKGEDMRTGNAQFVVGRFLQYALLLGVAFLTVTPFLYMISISLRPDYKLLIFPISLIPDPLSLANYVSLFGQRLISRWIFNSAFVSMSVVILQLFTSSLAGYAFARGEFIGREVIFWLLVSTLMVPGTVSIVPLFLLISDLNWADTYFALIVPFMTSIFGTFLVRQFINTIPRAYDEAALIDGASRFGIYWRIILPMSKPALATLSTLTFIGHWNSFLYPLVMTHSDRMRPLTVGVATMAVRSGNAGFEMAAATIAFLPTFLFFLVMQRYVVRGISLTGIAGV
jgi:multiple sugar transport system permease protein